MTSGPPGRRGRPGPWAHTPGSSSSSRNLASLTWGHTQAPRGLSPTPAHLPSGAPRRLSVALHTWRGSRSTPGAYFLGAVAALRWVSPCQAADSERPLSAWSRAGWEPGSSPDTTCWVMLGQSPNSLPCFPLHDTEVTAVPKRASWQRWVRAINRSKWRCPALGGVPSEPGSPPQEEHDGVDGHNGDGKEDSGDNDDSAIEGVGKRRKEGRKMDEEKS